MHMHQVKSSQIREIGHDEAAGTLAVRFNTGALYHYKGVSAKKFKQFMDSDSKGSFFGRHIKCSHEYARIAEKKEH